MSFVIGKMIPWLILIIDRLHESVFFEDDLGETLIATNAQSTAKINVEVLQTQMQQHMANLITKLRPSKKQRCRLEKDQISREIKTKCNQILQKRLEIFKPAEPGIKMTKTILLGVIHQCLTRKDSALNLSDFFEFPNNTGEFLSNPACEIVLVDSCHGYQIVLQQAGRFIALAAPNEHQAESKFSIGIPPHAFMKLEDRLVDGLNASDSDDFSEEQAHKWLEGQQEFMHGLCQKSSQDLAPEQAEFKHLFLQTILDSIGAQFFPQPMFFASHVIGLQTENYTSSATPS
jgi:hypothetical protein